MQLDEFIRRFQSALSLQIQDANNQGDRSGAMVLQRISNAIERTQEQAALAAAKVDLK